MDLWIDESRAGATNPIIHSSANPASGDGSYLFTNPLITFSVFACGHSARHGFITGQDEREVLESVGA